MIDIYQSVYLPIPAARPRGAAVRAARCGAHARLDAGVLEIDVELPMDDAKTLPRTAATGHVRSIPARD
jgi:hypothetical protein